MHHIVQVSGGKDSTATILWAIEKGLDFQCVFCDTGNESPITYEYIDYLEKELNLNLLRLKPKLDFFELAKKKGRFPSAKARFCTSELKIVPFIDWLLQQSGDFRIYMGIRAQESPSRATMAYMDDYFKLDNKNQYAKRKAKAWLANGNTAITVLPIHGLSHDEIFEMHKKHNIKPNPLYTKGFNRVGCFPCIMCRQNEIKNIASQFPKVIDHIRSKEIEVGSTFFGPDFIPNKKIAKIDEVIQYVNREDNPNQMEFFKLPTCKSIYNVCE
jgi:3'-phosphoadenosine 5'-phosphosulfate sulfotransferase (PAPS reductase)/FAD synthetase